MLGRGSYGSVFKRDGFAVKKSNGGTFEGLQAISRELYVLRKNLPFCIPFHGVKNINDTYFIYLDLADNDLLKPNMPQDTCLQIIQGVYHLHLNNIVHRDLKPENILVKGNHVFLCDFGLSRFLPCNVKDGTSYIVSRWYRAPEIHYNKKKFLEYTKAMDCWALGCLLYQIKTTKILNKDMTFDFKVEDPLIAGLCTIDSEERWTMERCLKHMDKQVCEKKIKLPKMEKSLSMRSFHLYKQFDNKEVFEMTDYLYARHGYYDEMLMISILLLRGYHFYSAIKSNLNLNFNMLRNFIKDKDVFQHIDEFLSSIF